MGTDTTSRRGFMKSAAALTSLSIMPGAVLGANDRISLGFVGVGGMGLAHLIQYAKMQDVHIAAICDVDAAKREQAKAASGGSPKLVSDFRKLLEMKDVDAIVCATPEHWHPIIALRAFEAGKDAYIEKPLAHNIREGRLVADAAQQHQRIVQIGYQQRSGSHWGPAVERIKAGELGKISMVHAWNAWNGREMLGDMGNPPEEPVPDGVDYDMWLGPAPLRPFNRNRFHGKWYFFWDYSGGMVSGWGCHLFDIVGWAMGHDVLSAACSGGKFVTTDNRDTPDTATAIFTYPNFTLTYSMRHYSGWRPHDNSDHGIEFFGDNATLQITRGGYKIFLEEDRTTRTTHVTEKLTNDSYWDHKRNWLECIRTRQQPRCNAETGHQSTIFGHLANIAYRTGRTLQWDRSAETFKNGAEACAYLTREYRQPWGV